MGLKARCAASVDRPPLLIALQVGLVVLEGPSNLGVRLGEPGHQITESVLGFLFVRSLNANVAVLGAETVFHWPIVGETE